MQLTSTLHLSLQSKKMSCVANAFCISCKLGARMPPSRHPRLCPDHICTLQADFIFAIPRCSSRIALQTAYRLPCVRRGASSLPSCIYCRSIAPSDTLCIHTPVPSLPAVVGSRGSAEHGPAYTGSGKLSKYTQPINGMFWTTGRSIQYSRPG